MRSPCRIVPGSHPANSIRRAARALPFRAKAETLGSAVGFAMRYAILRFRTDHRQCRACGGERMKLPFSRAGFVNFFRGLYADGASGCLPGAFLATSFSIFRLERVRMPAEGGHDIGTVFSHLAISGRVRSRRLAKIRRSRRRMTMREDVSGPRFFDGIVSLTGFPE